MARPVVVAEPRSDVDVVQVLEIASNRGLEVRPVGAGHSFSPIASTDGVLMQMTGLADFESIDLATGVAWFGAGTLMSAAAAQLGKLGLALENMGDVARQTLGGAAATGTHGTGMRFPGMAGQLVGLRMVLANGAVVTCSADEQPDLFHAARVGVGMFGVITALAVRTVPAFLLAADEHAEPVGGLLEDFKARMSAADHVEFYWFPHTSTALVKSNIRLPIGADTYSRLPRWRFLIEEEFVNNGLFGASCYASLLAPQLVPTLNRVAARLVAARRYADLSPQVFTSPRRVRFREMEYAVPLAAVPEMVWEIERTIRRHGWRISFPLEVRVADADDAWLSPAYGRQTGYVAVHRFHREPFAAYFRSVEDIALAAGGRPHWGKLHTATGPGLSARYPRFTDAAAVRDRVDPGGLFINPWVRRLVSEA